jgi:2-oxoglutarate dehydrogenase E2 component (dihydrolipoamide succinyltransferase)
MSFEVKIPSVGESITEVTIANIVKKDGEFVNLDDVICELESDKATFELNAPQSGVLRWNVQQGDTIAIGSTVCQIESKDQVLNAIQVAASTTGSASSEVTTAKTIEVKVPVVGESISEVTLATWNRKTGDLVNSGEILCEIESDKATFELPAEGSGILTVLVEKGITVPIGTLIATIASGASSASISTDQPNELGATSQPVVVSEANKSATSSVTPLAAKNLADKGINPASVTGSGEGGKITKDDALKANSNPPKTVVPSGTANQTAPSSGSGRVSRREKLSSLRKTVARRLVAVKNETAMLTTFNEVDMKPIMDLRTKYKDKFKEKHSVGLGFMSFFTKAVCVALSEFPSVNAMIDGDEIIFNDFADISIAVSAPKGLVVPVIRNAEQMDFAEIEKEILRLAGKARDNKLSIEEMTGGTFTITNGGVFGSMLSTPIINAPQSAILGMHNIVERPVAINGEIVIRPIMYVALSYDHRIIDGRESVGFLVRVKQLLEDPLRLLLDV